MREQDTTKCKYCGRMVIHPCPDCHRDWGHGCCGTCGGRQYVGEHHSHEQCLGFQLQDAKAQIDAAWQMIESEYDVEPRAQLEKEAATNGFKYGLAQAVHHIWKREPKVQASLGEDDRELLRKCLDSLGIKHYSYSGVDEEMAYSCLIIADPNSDESKLVPLFTFKLPEKKLVSVGVRQIDP